MKLDNMASPTISRHKIIPVRTENNSSRFAKKRKSDELDNDDWSVTTTTKPCAVGVWTVSVCNGQNSVENKVGHVGMTTRSCALRGSTQSRLNFTSSPKFPKMIIKLSRNNGSEDSSDSVSEANLTNGHSKLHTLNSIGNNVNGAVKTSTYARRSKSYGRLGRKRKAVPLANSRIVNTASVNCDIPVANDSVPIIRSPPKLNDVSNGSTVCYTRSHSKTFEPASPTGKNIASPTSKNVAGLTSASCIVNGRVRTRGRLAAQCSPRHAKFMKNKVNLSKRTSNGVTSKSCHTSAADTSIVRNTKMTDFFPVRRSSRTTSAQIKKKEKEKMEEFVLSKREEGLMVREISGKGRGVVTKRVFSRGEYLVEYAGELVDYAVAKEREAEYSLDQRLGCYMYYFSYKDHKYCVDATEETSRLGRLINHSRLKPNCATKILEIEGQPRLIFVALRRIEGNEELLYDYGDRDRETLGSHPWLAF